MATEEYDVSVDLQLPLNPEKLDEYTAEDIYRALDIIHNTLIIIASKYVVETDVTTLTDSTGGTANDTLVAISGSGDDANINNNFADLTAKVNAILAILAIS